jgi:hypothetical protein
MVNLKNSGRIDIVRRWSRVRKSVEADDRARYFGAVIGTIAVAAAAYMFWRHYNKPSRK